MRAIVLGVIAAAIAGSAAAAPVSVVQFSQTSAANDVTGANNPLLTGATGASTITISNAVANISQLLGNPAVNGVDVNLSATSIDNATTVGASGILQHYDGTFCLSSGPNCTGIDFLSGSFSDAAFGTAAGSQLTVNIANPPDTLSLTSAVIPASQLGAPSSLNFAFTSLSPALAIAANNSISAYTASFSGNASASAAAIPEPAGLALLGAGLAGLMLVRRRA